MTMEPPPVCVFTGETWLLPGGVCAAEAGGTDGPAICADAVGGPVVATFAEIVVPVCVCRDAPVETEGEVPSEADAWAVTPCALTEVVTLAGAAGDGAATVTCAEVCREPTGDGAEARADACGAPLAVTPTWAEAAGAAGAAGATGGDDGLDDTPTDTDG